MIHTKTHLIKYLIPLGAISFKAVFKSQSKKKNPNTIHDQTCALAAKENAI